MDIYEYLKLDHKKVDHLFKQFENSTLKDRQQQIVTMIAEELLLHAHSESAVFYKALSAYPFTKESAQHGEKEHQEIEHKIKTALHFDQPTSAWKKNVKSLQETVEHHVKEEEHEIFNKAKEVLTDEQAYELKEKMHHYKHKLLTSPKKRRIK